MRRSRLAWLAAPAAIAALHRSQQTFYRGIHRSNRRNHLNKSWYGSAQASAAIFNAWCMQLPIGRQINPLGLRPQFPISGTCRPTATK